MTISLTKESDVGDRVPPAGFQALWEQFPWPDSPPVPEAPLTGRNSAGFELLRDALDRLDKPEVVVLEVGAEFGGSTRKVLGFDNTYVVSVDPWPDSYGAGSFPELRPFLGGERGMYNLFLTFNFEYRDRLAAVREPAPAGLVTVHDAGVEVDCVYIDGDHRYDAVMRDLTVANSLFPNAMITGDDWLFNPHHRKYEDIRLPVQTAVKRFAAVNDMCVHTDHDTWLLDPRERFNLKRPVPSFGARKAPAPAPAAPAVDPAALGEVRDRLTAIEGSLSELAQTVTAPWRERIGLNRLPRSGQR